MNSVLIRGGDIVLPPPRIAYRSQPYLSLQLINMAARAWCFTLNNPTFPAADLPVHPNEKFVSWQLEQVTVPHIQGYIELTMPRRLANMRTWLPAAHFERRRGTAQEAKDYTEKEDSRIEGPWSRGEFQPNAAGKRNDLDAVKAAIKAGATRQELLEEHSEVMAKYPRFCTEYLRSTREAGVEKLPSPLVPMYAWQSTVLDLVAGPVHARHIHWVYDASGNHGKTYLAKYLVDHHSAFYTNGGKAVDLTYAYDSEPVVVFDFVRDAQEYVGYGVIEQLKNGILFSPKYESGLKRFNVPHIFVFSNFRAAEGKFSSDRLQELVINNDGSII